MRLLAFSLAVFAALCSFLPAHAEVFGAADSLELKVTPDFPAPFSTITVTPQSSLLPLARSDVAVSVNGTPVFKGSGAESIPVTLGAAGKPVKIHMSVSVDGATYQKDVSITPQDLSLIIEPIGTVHPLYQGASLIPSQGHVRIVALADFRKTSGEHIPANSLSYTWHFGDQLLAAQSGIGKSVLDATAPIRYRNAEISVTVVSPDQTSVAGGRIMVAPQDPKIRIYRNDPLLGPNYDAALSGTASITDSEETFRVVPYFFSAAPLISWTVNSAPSGSEKDITLRPTGNGAGTASLGVKASRDSEFQSASQNLSISFGAQKSLGIFGL